MNIVVSVSHIFCVGCTDVNIICLTTWISLIFNVIACC